MEAGILFDSVKKIDGRIVTGVGGKSVHRLCQNVIENDCLRQRSIVNATEDGERSIVCVISLIRRCEEDRRVEQGTRYLFGIDAPGVVVGSYICFRVSVVALEVTKCACPLLNDVDADTAILFNMPAKLVTVVDSDFSPDSSRDVRLVARHLALGVDTVTTHIA